MLPPDRILATVGRDDSHMTAAGNSGIFNSSGDPLCIN